MFKRAAIAVLVLVMSTGLYAQQRDFFDNIVEIGKHAVVGTAAGAIVGSLACDRRNSDCRRQMAATGMVAGGAVGYAGIQNSRAMEMAQQPVTQMYCERAIDPRTGQWVLVNCREAVSQTTIGRRPYWVPR